MSAITISEIAALAGVSVATVSRVLNGKGNVSADTRRHVMQVVERYNYSPNLVGRHLRTKETRIILVILTSVANSFSSRVVGGIDEEAQKHGYHTLVCMTGDRLENEKSYLNLIRDGVADGAIIMNTAMSREEFHAFSEKYNVVQCSEFIDADAPYVSIDNVQAAYDAVRHLLEIGRRRIAYCGVKNHFTSSHRRYGGYVKALHEFGIREDREIIYDGDYGFRSAWRLTRERLEAGKVFDGLFTISDRMAAGAISAVQQAGKRVPADVAVVGFDNIDISYMMRPTITTVAQPKKELGQEAFFMLLKRLQGETPASKLLKYSMVLRESTKI